MFGEPLPEQDVEPQGPPKKGAGPRVDVDRSARRIAKLPHVVLAYRGGDGYPMIVSVAVTGPGRDGLRLDAGPGLLPEGGRRAGLLAHGYGKQLVAIAARQHTGWLTVSGREARYAPHTEQGFRAPSSKTLLLLANGLLAKRGLRKAEREGTLEKLRAA